MINLEWYRSFIAIYRTGTVTGAAEACALTQPAVSQHLAALEKLIGEALFLRTPRRMIPTPRGKELYAQIAQSFDLLEQTSQRFINLGNSEKPLLRIGTPLEYFYDEILEKLPQAPFRFWFEFDTAQQIAQRLAEGELDIIITTQRTPIRTIEYQLLTEETFWLVSSIHQTFPFAQITVDDLSALESWLTAQPWISYGVELPIIRRFWQQVFDHRPALQPDYVIPNLHAIAKAVELDYGLTVLPDYLCHQAVEEKRLQVLWQPPTPVANELWFGFRQIDRSNVAINTFEAILTNSAG